MSSRQRTLKSPVSLAGVGLHTGVTVDLTIQPAPENHGYRFQRTDLDGQPIINADCDLVVGTQRGTTLEQNGARVYTTEHVLAALYGCKVDNALIQLNGPEVPILDGSAWPFVEAIEAAGYQEQNADRLYLTLKENITFENTEKGVEFLAVPTAGGEFRLTVMVDYNSPVLGTQHAHMYQLNHFKTEIARCRTFVFLQELEVLAKNGLIKGGSLDNAIVMVDKPYSEDEIQSILKMLGKEDLKVKVEGIGVLNTTKLQYENEPARHKLLDIVGDLALVGRFIRGHMLAARPGHFGNVEFAKVLKGLIKREKEAPRIFDLYKKPLFDINDISKMLPHRYPFLLVDKIMEMDEAGIIGLKNVTLNEPFFQGHFPGNPIMPGVLQVEAMAQVGGIFALSQVPDPENYSTYFMKIDGVKFKQKVIPGDTLIFDLHLESPIRRGLVNMKGRAYVNGKEVCEATMLAQIVKDRTEKETKVSETV
ncbi:MAG: bifunctional UDP-3-O-[3-hydroxymyristoyl] N-acetylglucosamine deacetylase/3-hydroxyacyl-ACP dehydratase [Crocinitomicaceae bacterium]|nr:bifunctional UDP-3-O-[3-hydroxymyristoyl] N-acetylglucosamine deacetylase/3-hydroxyacyl-ACP dehydratase [Crocinitomicaceae bacterium]